MGVTDMMETSLTPIHTASVSSEKKFLDPGLDSLDEM
jgi:hypothetical protein